MKITKKIIGMMLALVMVLSLLPASVFAAEEECVYLSVSFDGAYIDDQYGKPMVYVPVPLDVIEAVDLAAYGLENMQFDIDDDGNYEITALQLLIYAHEELYGGDWSEVDFSAYPGSSYFSDGIFGFTENLVYFHNGDFPVDETQQSDDMTVGATSDRIVLEAGDFLDVASFGCYAFLWDTAGGFHLFADEAGNYVHDYAAEAGQPMPVKLMHSFCDLMYGQSWVNEAADYEVYYGEVFGEAEGSFTTDGSGCAEITFPEAGTYYLWCYGDNSEDYGTHGGCDYCLETGEPCIVSAPAYAKVTVAGAEAPVEPELFDLAGNNMTLGNELILNFMFKQSDLPDGEGVYAVLTHELADGKEDKVKTVAFDAETWKYNNGDTYYFVSMSVYASQMADDITVVLYNKDGEAISNPKTCSVRTYLMNNIDKDTFNAKMKTVAVDMLNYGAASQEYNKYNVSDLANNQLTDTQKAYGTPAAAPVNRQVKGDNCAGANLSLLQNIELNIMFTGYVEGRYAEVTYTNFKDEEVSYRVEGTSYSSGKYTSVKVNTVRLSDGDTLINVTLYNADGTVCGTGSDSVDGYAARMTRGDDLYEMVARLTASAKAYALG